MQKLEKLIEASPEYQSKNIILQNVPGVGSISAVHIIVMEPLSNVVYEGSCCSLLMSQHFSFIFHQAVVPLDTWLQSVSGR